MGQIFRTPADSPLFPRLFHVLPRHRLFPVAESKYYPQMVLEYSDTLGVIPSQSIHEKETLHSGSSVPGPDGILAGYHGGIWRSTWTILWILALLFWQKVPVLDTHGLPQNHARKAIFFSKRVVLWHKTPRCCGPHFWSPPHSSVLDGFRHSPARPP